MFPPRPARRRSRSIGIAAILLLLVAPAVSVGATRASLPGGADTIAANAIGPSLETALVAGGGQGGSVLTRHPALPGSLLFPLIALLVVLAGSLRVRRTSDSPAHVNPQAAPAARPSRAPPVLVAS
jgi:hypothetical protein